MHRIELTGTDSGLTFDVELQPDQRVYCFIGENGAGKTSLLEGLAQVMMFTHEAWRRGRGDFSDRQRQQPVRERLDSIVLRVPDGRIDGRSIKHAATWGVTGLLQIETGGGTEVDYCRRPLVYVPALQRATIEGIGPAALSLVGDHFSTFADTIERTLRGLRRESLDASTVSMWFASRLLVNPAFVVGLRNPQEEVIALLRTLKSFDPIHFGRVLDSVALTYANGTLLFLGRPIDRLASGYVALLKIFQEIVSSIAAWEGMRESTDILGSDAIILIDEIDAHLHPKWQRNLLPFLKRTFPRATFYVATHSPLVVRDTEPGEAYELVREGDRVTARALGSPRDWFLSDVLADAFHVDLPVTGSGISGDCWDEPAGAGTCAGAARCGRCRADGAAGLVP